jgi:hypothetical protein
LLAYIQIIWYGFGGNFSQYGVGKKNVPWKNYIYNMDPNTSRENVRLERMKEIASFYDDPKGAMELLKRSNQSSITRKFLEREKDAKAKRIAHKIKSPLSILELALDETSLPPSTGHSLGLPAYQAEMRYRG